MKSIKRDTIINFCNKYLKVEDFKDGCVNGLQIEGEEKVRKIITGVSLSEKLIKETIKEKAEMIIVHHGFFSNTIPSPLILKGVMKKRIKMLLENDITLCGYHLPLDAHPVIGNNIIISKLLGLKKIKPFDVGFIGEIERKIDLKNLVQKVNKKINTKSIVLKVNNDKINKVVVISGSASSDYEISSEIGAQVLVTGDLRENVVREAEEAGINIINAGHYNTEVFGVQKLAKLINQKFKIDAEFIDIPNNI